MNDYYGMDYASAEALESAMETMEVAFWVSAILSVALFIKLWIMCNNVRDIKKQSEKHSASINKDDSDEYHLKTTVPCLFTVANLQKN